MFSTRTELSLVLSDCSIIDAVGDIVAKTRFKSGQFHPGALRNIVRNSYLGCSMAFRRSILDYCLPIPADIPMHDMWIGILNQLVGKTGFIDEPLICYRRHENNISPGKHAPLPQMIRWRWALVKNLILRIPARRAHEETDWSKFRSMSGYWTARDVRCMLIGENTKGVKCGDIGSHRRKSCHENTMGGE